MSDSLRKEIKREVYARVIEAFRESLGVTVQQEIADLLGVKKQKLQDWKNGRSDPRDYIVEISELTGRSFKWLLTGKTEGDQSQDQGFRDSLFYKLYVACQGADPEKVRFVEQFMTVALEELQSKPNQQVLLKKKSRPK